MKNKLLHFLILFAASMTACDKVEGPDPAGGQIPKSTAGLIIQRFPNATNVTFRTVEEDHLWEARFDDGKVSYYAGMQADKILAVQQLISTSIPDSIEQIIKSRIPIAKLAHLSDYRQDLLPSENADKLYYRAKMTVDGATYLIKWNFSRNAGNGKTRIEFGMHEYSLFEFDTDVRAEPLPAALKAFQDRTQYVVAKLKTKVLDIGKMHYHFTPENRDAVMVLDNSGLLIGSYHFTEVYKAFEEFPLLIQVRIKYFGAEHYQTSVFSGRFSEDNNAGYRILGWSDSTTCDFFFDANGGLPSFNYGLIVDR